MLKNYDPYKLGTPIVQITFQRYDYTGHLAWNVEGNCRGADLLNCDFLDGDTQDDIDEYLLNDCEFEFDEEKDVFSAVLKNENGEILNEVGDSRHFAKMIVRMEIIEVSYDTLEGCICGI